MLYPNMPSHIVIPVVLGYSTCVKKEREKLTEENVKLGSRLSNSFHLLIEKSLCRHNLVLDLNGRQHIHMCITDCYKASVKIMDVVSYTTYVVCVNFTHARSTV